MNGVVVTRFRINPLIGTLAMSFVVAGIAAIVTKGNLVVAFDHPDFQQFAATRIAGITSAAWMMIITAIAATILLSRTTFGRYVYATGGNAQAARLGGVRNGSASPRSRSAGPRRGSPGPWIRRGS